MNSIYYYYVKLIKCLLKHKGTSVVLLLFLIFFIVPIIGTENQIVCNKFN